MTLAEIHASLAIKRRMAVRREEYLDYMTFKSNQRTLFDEFLGPLIGLKEEWKAQGASPEELDLSAFRFRGAECGPIPVNTGWLGRVKEKLLEETAEHIIVLDHMGRKLMLCKGAASLPLPLNYPVKNMDDWRKIKHQYLFAGRRFCRGWEELVRTHRKAGRVVTFHMHGGFDEPRQLLGDEAVCVAYYEQPELIHDILNTLGDMALHVMEQVISRVQIDQLAVHEDMAGKSGPLAGPKQVTEFIKPYYRRLWDRAQEGGARLFAQDSDGDMNAVIPAFLDAGLNVMFPMEPAANMDIVKIRRQYGKRLALAGGIDKHVLRGTKAEIVKELEYKIPPMVRTGACVLSLDHRIPNGTPLEHYRFYIKKAWEIIERESRK